MSRYLLHLSFKGTAYHGWQIQENAVAVQALIDDRLSQIFAVKTETAGCGRTDTGVHSTNFFAHFDAETEYDEATIAFKLNRMLPGDIVVYKVCKVSLDFNSRFDALSRTYHYYILKRRNPFIEDLAWHYHQSLDTAKMNDAAALLLEYEDYGCFSKGRTQVKTKICKISEAFWLENNEMYVFRITADRFLRNMVRAIVGTVVQVGLGKMNTEDFRDVILSKNRRKAAESVTGKGLYLTDVKYPVGFLEDLGVEKKGLPHFHR